MNPLYSGKCTEHLTYSKYVGLLDYEIVFRLCRDWLLYESEEFIVGIPLVKSLSIHMRIGVYHLSSETFYLVCSLQDELLRNPGSKSSLSPILWRFIQFATCNKCGSKSSHFHSSNWTTSQTAYVERKEYLAWQGQGCREGGQMGLYEAPTRPKNCNISTLTPLSFWSFCIWLQYTWPELEH